MISSAPVFNAFKEQEAKVRNESDVELELESSSEDEADIEVSEINKKDDKAKTVALC